VKIQFFIDTNCLIGYLIGSKHFKNLFWQNFDNDFLN